jgi:hypothetical protein
MTLDVELKIVVEVDIISATPGYRETRTDPGGDPEIDFVAYVRNNKNERVLLQDEILLQNIDVIYDQCLEFLADEYNDRAYNNHRRSRA